MHSVSSSFHISIFVESLWFSTHVIFPCFDQLRLHGKLCSLNDERYVFVLVG